MRQVLLNSQEAFVARMPRPVLKPGTVLVRVQYSMISIGTEVAGLRQQKAPALAAAQGGELEGGAASLVNTIGHNIKRASVLSSTAFHYLGKAVKNPDKAKQRIKMIVQQQMAKRQREAATIATEAGETVVNKPHNETLDQGWNVGYSAMGEVIGVGPDVTDLSVGDLVACAGAGKANHADYICVSRHLVSPLPAGCDPVAAASTTIGTIAMQGVRRAAPQLGETVAVIGLGLIGQITVQMLKNTGTKVIGMDMQADRVALAKTEGLSDGSDDVEAYKKAIKHATQGKGADITIITAATKSNSVISLAMEVTRRKGRVVIVGDVGLAPERVHFYQKEIDLLMSTSYGPGRYDANYEENGQDYPIAYVRWTLNRNMQAYLSMIANGQLNIGKLVEKVESIDNATAVYDELATSEKQPLAVVFSYPDEEKQLPQKPDATAISIMGHRKATDVPINYVLVGVGAFGTSMLVPKLDALNKTFFLRGVVSRDAVRGGNYARAQQLELLASGLDEVVTRHDVHMLVIATRHNEHAEQVIAGINSGKHVFVEKPLVTNWEQFDAVQAAYEKQSNPPMVMVGFNRRFSPAMQALREKLQDRKAPLMMQYRLNGGYIALDHWIQTAAGAGRNIGEACHMYDCFRSLAGAPVCEISAMAINPGDLPFARNDNFIATLRYEDGSVATLTYTASGPKKGLPKERLEVFCDGEAYILDDYRSLTEASTGDVLWTGETDKGHAKEMAAIEAHLTKEAPAPISFAEIMETTAVSLRVEDLLNGCICE